MNTMTDADHSFERDISGKELAAVTFIRDYIQLCFDGPILTCHHNPSVHMGEKKLERRDPNYCDSLVALIGSTVENAMLTPGKCIKLMFSCGHSIEISLRPEDYQFGPEAVLYTGSAEGNWWVF